MFKYILGVVVAFAVASVAYAAATEHTVTGGTISTGVDDVLACDDQVNVLGWTFDWTDADAHPQDVTEGLADGVRIGGIAEACAQTPPDDNRLFFVVMNESAVCQADGWVNLYTGQPNNLNVANLNSPGVTFPFTPCGADDTPGLEIDIATIDKIRITLEGAHPLS